MPSRPVLARILPFALFMAFIGIEELLRALQKAEWLLVPENLFLILYPIKIIAVTAVLVYFRHDYDELHWRDLSPSSTTLVSILLGVTIFVLWIQMDWPWATFGSPQGFNPSSLPPGYVQISMIATRLVGAVLLVPIMEELFWRSFLFRYLIGTPFQSVSIGKSTRLAFFGTTLLFGLEHSYFIAGMMAGALFNWLFIHTRSLAQCILCHAVANLTLGLYVLKTSEWRFW